MSCHEMQDLLAAYEAGELAPAQREFVALHLEQCPACRAFLTDLQLTRRQLEGLQSERYHPQLTGRITAALARRRRWERALRWAGWTARLAGGLGAAAMVALLVLLVARGPEALPAPAAPPDTAAYVLAGEALLRVQPTTGEVREVAEVEGTVVGLSPDGATLWLARNLPGESFALDRLDLATGRPDRDDRPKPGHIHRGVVSADGRRLYLIGTYQDLIYLKVIDASRRTVWQAIPLAEFTAGATPMESPGGGVVHIIDAGRMATVTLTAEVAPVSVRRIPELTPAATLTGSGDAVLVAARGGGLLMLDLATFRTRRLHRGDTFTHLAREPSRGWLYAVQGNRLLLLTPDGRRTAATVRLEQVPVRAVLPLR